MIFLDKKQTKKLLSESTPPVNLYFDDRDEQVKLLKLMCSFPQWYNSYNISVNERGKVREIHKKKLGTNTYTFLTWVKNTNWGLQTTNGIKILFTYSIRGCDFQIENTSDLTKVIPAIQELREYLYNQNSWHP
jgi:hypothetical protein